MKWLFALLSAAGIIASAGCSSDRSGAPLRAVYATAASTDCGGGILRVATADDSIEDLRGTEGTYVALRWAPNTRRVAALASGVCSAADRVLLIDSGVPQSLRLVDLPDLEAPAAYSTLVWSPDSGVVAAAGDSLALVRSDGEIASPSTVTHVGPGAALWSADSRWLGVLSDDGLITVLGRDGVSVSQTNVASGDLRGGRLLGWAGTHLVLWGQAESDSALKVQSLMEANGRTPHWGPVEDFSVDEDSLWYGSLPDDRLARLQRQALENEPDARWLLGGEGLSSDGRTVWTVAETPPTYLEVFAARADGSLARIQLTGLANAEGQPAPLIDVIESRPD